MNQISQKEDWSRMPPFRIERTSLLHASGTCTCTRCDSIEVPRPTARPPPPRQRGSRVLHTEPGRACLAPLFACAPRRVVDWAPCDHAAGTTSASSGASSRTAGWRSTRDIRSRTAYQTRASGLEGRDDRPSRNGRQVWGGLRACLPSSISGLASVLLLSQHTAPWRRRFEGAWKRRSCVGCGQVRASLMVASSEPQRVSAAACVREEF